MSIRNLKFFLKPADFFVFLIFCGIIFTSFGSIVISGGKKVLRISTPTEDFEYSMTENKEIVIDGIAGKTEFKVENSKVFVVDSACKNKLCVHQGCISRPGQWLLCAPNRVFAIIETTEKNKAEIDAFSY